MRGTYPLIGLLLGVWWLTGCGADDDVGIAPPEPEVPALALPSSFRWQVPLNADSSYHEMQFPPLLVDHRILFTGASQSTTIAGEALHCVDLAGQLQWTWNDYTASLRSNTIEVAAVAGSTVVIQAGNDYYGIDLADGSTRWHRRLQIGGQGALVPFEDRCYQRFEANVDGDYVGTSIRYFDVTDGTVHRVFGQIDPPDCEVSYSTPAVRRGADGSIIVYYTAYACPSREEGFIRYHAYNETNGQNDFRRVSEQRSSGQLGPPIITDTHMIVVHRRLVEARDLETGVASWVRDLPNFFHPDEDDYTADATGLYLWNYSLIAAAYALTTGETRWQRGGGSNPFRHLVVGGPYAVGTGSALQPLDPQSGTLSLALEPFNPTPPSPAPQIAPQFEFGGSIDPLRDRFYASDGYFLVALELPL